MKILSLAALACLGALPTGLSAEAAQNTLLAGRSGVANLPLVEVRAVAGSVAQSAAARFILLLSGDGGWAGLDQDIARSFAGAGVPVVGFNSLRYFWNERTPEESARDIARVLQHYLDAWHEERVEVVGYSFGADVLPFIIGRLPADLRSKVGSITLISPSSTADFEIHVADWLPKTRQYGMALLPQIEQLATLPLLCLYGKGDADALCPHLAAGRALSVELGAGHHLGGNGQGIVERILRFADSGH